MGMASAQTWAPCLRFHKGTFYVFSNVNGQTTQLFRATNPAGPWTCRDGFVSAASDGAVSLRKQGAGIAETSG